MNGWWVPGFRDAQVVFQFSRRAVKNCAFCTFLLCIQNLRRGRFWELQQDFARLRRSGEEVLKHRLEISNKLLVSTFLHIVSANTNLLAPIEINCHTTCCGRITNNMGLEDDLYN